MYKFDDTSIVAGYIKQLLASFNLPKFKVYNPKYTKKIIETVYATKKESYMNNSDGTTARKHVTYVPYIKDGQYQEYVKSDGGYKWVDCHYEIKEHQTAHKENSDGYYRHFFIYNKKDLNFTKKLQIKNNVYDSYTHEYLGDYLRFIRDYHNINLMPLYNCFSNRFCPHINYSFSANSQKVTFSTRDKNYKIFMLPVKLLEDYTIAIESNLPVEVFCGLYGAYFDDSSIFTDFMINSYEKLTNTNFKTPRSYSKLRTYFENKTDDTTNLLLSKLAEREKDLKLFIKLPVDTETSITILEGDYSGYNNRLVKIIETSTANDKFSSSSYELVREQNQWVVNFENQAALDNFKPITDLQLLRGNTGESYPFATRLIEYLVGSAITNLDQIEDNVIRTKTIIDRNLSNAHIEPSLDENNQIKFTSTLKDSFLFEVDGLWTDDIKSFVYSFMNSDKNANIAQCNHDILGYIDRDVERMYKSTDVESKKSTTIAEVDIYTQEDGSYEWN